LTDDEWQLLKNNDPYATTPTFISMESTTGVTIFEQLPVYDSGVYWLVIDNSAYFVNAIPPSPSSLTIDWTLLFTVDGSVPMLDLSTPSMPQVPCPDILGSEQAAYMYCYSNDTDLWCTFSCGYVRSHHVRSVCLTTLAATSSAR
jgi:hypothetical protein